MAYDSALDIRVLIGWATRGAATTGKTPVQILQEAIDQIVSENIADGKVLINATEGGGNIQYAIPQGETPRAVAARFQFAVEVLQGRRQLRRLRASFRHTLP